MPFCQSEQDCSNHGVCKNQVCECASGWEGGRCQQSTITTVHVVQSCHLDVGFADTAPGIINRYFDTLIPRAISVAAELKADKTTSASLQFMFQSYVLSLYLDCPAGMQLHCPGSANVTAVKEAIQQGVIWYHAFPFNAELELYDPVFVEEGIRLSHDLDEMFGFAQKATLSQRDVPGTTRAVIPLLLKNNVTAISVGVNGASTPPQVPKAFLWRDEAAEGSPDILAMWHPYGYGGDQIVDAVIVPGLSHALVMDWNGDNAGPFTAQQYKDHFALIQKEFPKAQVVSSTFDNFTQHLNGVRSTLPVVTSEVGDTWIYGVPSDPKRAAVNRVMNRVWANYVAGGGETSSVVYKNATRLALKLGEHTWGLDVKSNLKDNTSWTNADFTYAKFQGPARAQFGVLEDSWWRQRAWSYEFAIQALQDGQHPMVANLTAELQALAAKIPSPEQQGYTKTDPTKSYVIGTYTLGFDSGTGALTKLRHGSVDWASVSNPIGGLLYRTYSSAEITQFLSSYLVHDGALPDWAFHDFGKPGCTTECIQARYFGALKTLWTKQIPNGQSFLVQLGLAPQKGVDPHVAAGAPEQVWLQYDVLSSSEVDDLLLTVTIENKTATRLPEAMFLNLNPLSKIPGNGDASMWFVDKFGEWISGDDVVNGGSRHLHAASSGIRLKQGGAASIGFYSLDAPVFCLGEPDAYPTPTNSTPDTDTFGVSNVLWDNLWGTNYIMWWPFAANFTPVAAEANIQFRYQIRAAAHH